MVASPALLIERIGVRYGTRLAVDNVSISVGRGEIVGILGPNGSGKSTTLAVAAGVIEPFQGVVVIEGIAQRQAPQKYAMLVGLVPQEPALYDDLSAEANLQFFAKIYGLRGTHQSNAVTRALEQSCLADRRASRVSTFSGGMKQRLNLAVALLHNPTVLLLDEPTAALDPASRDSLFATLHDLREAGHAILLSTHHLDEAEYGCDRIVVLEAGQVVAAGRPSELIRYQPADRAILYAQLREALPKFFQKSLRKRMHPETQLEFTGRRLRISAPTSELLGKALATILADGIEMETFRTPPGRMEHLTRPVAVSVITTRSEVPTRLP